MIVQIHKALDRAVDFNERVTVFTTGRACTLSSDIKGGNATDPYGRNRSQQYQGGLRFCLDGFVA